MYFSKDADSVPTFESPCIHWGWTLASGSPRLPGVGAWCSRPGMALRVCTDCLQADSVSTHNQIALVFISSHDHRLPGFQGGNT